MNSIPSVLRRFAAYAIDNLLLAAICVLTFILLQEASLLVAFWICVMFAFLLRPMCELFFGRTIGKFLTGLKVLSTDFQPIGFLQAIVRFLCLFLEVSFVIGIVTFLIDKKGRRIGDLLAGTVVVHQV